MAYPGQNPVVWRELIPLFPHDSTLRAEYCSTGWADVTDRIDGDVTVSQRNSRWILTGGTSETRSLFESTARLGAAALGYLSRPNVYEDWLDCLIHELNLPIEGEATGGFTYPDWSERKGTDLADFHATRLVSRIGTVEDVFEKSRMFCRKLEAEALAADLETARTAPDVSRSDVAPEASALETRDVTSSLGEAIDYYRRECGWTYEQLAEQANISRDSVIDHINHGVRPRIGPLAKYARVFSTKLLRPISVNDLWKDDTTEH